MVGVPFDVLVIMLIVIPLAVTLLMGAFAFRRVTKLAYRCRRCDAAFLRPSHRGFPQVCPRCHARDWNAER